MTSCLSDHEKRQSDFWDDKSVKETFEFLDKPGIIERDDFLTFINERGKANVLEIGAGTGRWTIPLLQRGFRVTATDLSLKSLQVLQNKAVTLKLDENLTILHDNFEKPKMKRKYDAVFCFGVIHHFDPGKKKFILGNIISSLRVGGSIYILEPNPLNPLFYLIYFWRWLNNSQHLNRWSTERGFLESTVWNLKTTLKKIGISKIENKWYGYLPSRFANYIPFVLEFNKLFNSLPFCRLFSAYVWVKGKKAY